MKSGILEFEIRDEHHGPLRLFLLGSSDALDPFEQDPDEPSVKAERWLFVMAVAVGARWRFGNSFNRVQIIRFVADMRKSMGEHASDVNPRVAEELIRMALNDVHEGEANLTNRDSELDLMAGIAILDQLRDENIISESRMDEFLQQTKQHAQQMVEMQRALAAR
jgi:hypothetical protein